MAAIDRTIKLPNGDSTTIRVPEEWGKDEIEAGLKAQGMWKEATPPEPQDLPSIDEDAKPETAPKRDWQEEMNRQLGLTVRHAVQGSTAFPLMVGDAANALLNFIPGVDLGSPLQMVDAALTEAGLPEPETATERVVGAASQAVAGAGAGMASAARSLPKQFAAPLTEQAGVQGTAAAAGGAGFAGAAEADLGPVGQVVAGLGAAFAGAGATAASARALGKWADARALAGKPVSTAEIEAVTKAHGIHADSQELEQFQNAVNKIKEASEVRQVTLDALVPGKTDTVQVGRAKARVAREDMKRTIRGAFENDAERDDFVRRVIQKKTEDVRTDNMAPLEVQRARKRLGVQAANDAKIMDELRARQESLLAKLEAERTVPVTQPHRDLGRKVQDDVIRRNENVVRNADDEVGRGLTFGQKTIKRMEDIAPRIATAVRRSTVVGNRRTSEQVKRIDAWLKDTKIQKAMAKDNEYKAAVLNRDVDTMERMIPGSAGKYAEVEKMLDEYQQVLKVEGKAILEDGIHPRGVRDVKKLRKHMGTRNWGEYGKIRKARMNKLGRGWLTEHEDATIISQLVSGHPAKQFRGRTITSVSPEMAKFYKNPQSTLLDYIHGIEENIAAKAFFKDTLGQDIKLGNGASQKELRDHVGGVLARAIREDGLTSNDVDDLAELLDVHFGVARQGPGEVTRKFKDFFTGMTLGFNPLSTATQLGDVGIATARFGPKAIMTNTFGKQVGDLYETGLRNAASDFRTPHDFSTWFTKKGLQLFNFDKMDKFGNKAAFNGAYNSRRTLATKAPDRFRKEIEPLFGPRDTTKIMDDLANNRYSDDVATLMAHDVADIRPISREDMPLSWNKHPKGRVLYSLLSWSINQLNFARNTAYRNISQGVRRGITTKAGRAQAMRGVKDMIYLGTMFGVANMPAGITKDLMQGKELDPAGHFAAGVVPFGMTGKFAAEALLSHDPGSAAAKVVPVLGIPLQAAGRLLGGAMDGDVEQMVQFAPATRSLYKVITGEGVENVVGAGAAVLSKVLPAADAATHQYLDPNIPVTREAPAPQAEEVGPLPEAIPGIPGSRELPAPAGQEASRPTAEEELRLRAAIEQEQLQQEPAPVPLTKAEQTLDRAKALVREIAEGEGTSEEQAQANGFASGYDVPFGYGKHLMPPKPLTEMTVGEIKKFQTEQIKATKGLIPGSPGKGTSAVGKYQVLRGTLASMQKTLKFKDSDLFDVELQDSIGAELLNKRGYDKFLEGKITREKFQDNLSKEWASIADPRTGKSRYGQATGTTLDELEKALDS